MQAHTLGQISLVGPEKTVAFGEALSPLLHVGDTVLLEGEIGAGKSLLSRAIIQHRMAQAGRVEDVPSPTFTLVQVYEFDSAEVWHCDLYRLSSVDEVLELGLDDAFASAICLVEWPDRLGQSAPSSALHISMSAPAAGEDDSRLLTLRSEDPAWTARLAPLLEKVET